MTNLNMKRSDHRKDRGSAAVYEHSRSATRSTLITDSKLSALSSVSPTSSVRELSMRSLSSHSNSSNSDRSDSPPVHHRRAVTSGSVETDEPTRRRRPRPVSAVKASLDDSQSIDLQHIKDSVERLRAQRTHVEQMRRHTEQLETALSERSRENEKLRLQIVSLHGLEQENKGLLKSFQLLEERIRTLEATCGERKDDVRAANERVVAVEKDRDRLQLQLDELALDRDHLKKQLVSMQMTVDKRVEQATKTHEKALDKSKRSQSQWQAKAKDLQLSQSQLEHKFHEELSQLRQENHSLMKENRAMETQVQQLLATTVRQTTMIEDCDRALSESRQQYEAATASLRDQVDANSRLKDQLLKLEAKLGTREQEWILERHAIEKKALETETRVQKLKDKCDLYAITLREKENLVDKLQGELLVRDRTREHVDEVAKELRQQEKALRAEISELQVALADMTNERSIASEQARSLKHQLEKERKDRSRWATARHKLLAAFCDEEHKLNSALHASGRSYRTSLDLLESEELLGEEEEEELLVGGDLLAAEDDQDHRHHPTTTTTTSGFPTDRAGRRVRRDSKSLVFG